MERLKNIITLSEASKISGYHPDYLSALIRKGELKGEKTGGNWFTTTEEINNYIFKQKVRRSQPAFFHFLSRSRTQRIFTFAVFIFVVGFLLGLYLLGLGKEAPKNEAQKSLSPDPEVIEEISQ